MSWITVSTKEFLARKGHFDRGTHTPKLLRNISWPICSRCGLVYLKNERTRLAIRASCVIEVD